MSTDLVFDVSVALLRGATLLAPRFSVGPYRLATDDGEQRFACLDKAGHVVTAREEWDEIESHVDVDRSGWAAERLRREAHDWTAFGAARAFVAAAGEEDAAISLERAKEAA
jgi:hypothetical protein